MSLVIHTYRTRCTTVAQPPGFGDFLRGCAALYQLSEKYGFDLKVDFSNHPLSKFLEQYDCIEHDDSNEVHEFFNKDNILLEPFLSSLPEESLSLVTTHCVPVAGIDGGCQQFLKKRLSPNKQLKGVIKDIASQLGGEFCVVHLRMGDHAMGSNAAAVPVVDEWFHDAIVPEWGNKILVLSDNMGVKEHLSACFGIFYIDNIPVHLGQCGTLESPADGVRDALIDFFIMSRAKKIYQYSVYPWGSGFSDMCSRIYGVPLIKIVHPD